MKQQRVAQRNAGMGRGKLRQYPLGKFHQTRNKYDALVAELLKRPFPTLWAADDFVREFALPAQQTNTVGRALRLAGLQRMCIWLEYDPVTQKRNYIAIWRLLKTKLPEHLRHRRQWLREYRRQWAYIAKHRECIERLQQMSQYLAQSVA